MVHKVSESDAMDIICSEGYTILEDNNTGRQQHKETEERETQTRIDTQIDRYTDGHTETAHGDMTRDRDRWDLIEKDTSYF